MYQHVVMFVPGRGKRFTTRWYNYYQAVVQTLPRAGKHLVTVLLPFYLVFIAVEDHFIFVAITAELLVDELLVLWRNGACAFDTTIVRTIAEMPAKG